jgi:hypothetical protein
MITNPSASKIDSPINIPPIDKDIPEDIQTATFALG